MPDHARRLIRACWDLDGVYPDRKLWAWVHMLGFRGHFSSKSRRITTATAELLTVPEVMARLKLGRSTVY